MVDNAFRPRTSPGNQLSVLWVRQSLVPRQHLLASAWPGARRHHGVSCAAEMSIWEQYDLANRIAAILGEVPWQEEHHFGRPFLSAYQIAIEFRRRFPTDFAAIGLPIGGAGTGQHVSLPQYIARELSRRIRDEQLPEIEGRFLSDWHLAELAYDAQGERIRSSLVGAWDMAIFRLRG